MSIGISLKGTDRVRPATDGSTSRRPPVRHRDRDLAAAIAAATGLERRAACGALTATMAALGGRLPRSTGQRLADLLPHDLVRSVLAGEPTGARFGGFETFVREVASRSGLDEATARVGVLAVGGELQRRLSPPILREVCVEVPRVARLLLPDAWPGVSSDELSILRTGRVGPLCTAPLPTVPMCVRYHPWLSIGSDIRWRVP